MLFHRCLLAYLVVVVVALTTVAEAGQDRTSSPKPWSKRTPDGQPDLQGTWTNFDATPFEALEGEDVSELKGMEIVFPGITTSAGVRGPNPSADFSEAPAKRNQRRRALIVDPPAGRAPIRPEARRKRDESVAKLGDSWEHHNAWERCITRGIPGSMFAGYNAGIVILQTPGYVTFFYEMIHEARVIPVNDRPHLPSTLRLWNGDSRGRWEGDTLVVDVTNFNGRTVIGSTLASRRLRSIGQSDASHVVERFRRIDENTIEYDVTIDDPKNFTAPWKMATTLNSDPQFRIFEYACHEGNYGLPNILRGGRAAEGIHIPDR